MKKKKNRKLAYYMSLNYPFSVELYEEDGKTRFGLEIPELLGVWADGETIQEAYANLIETKSLWFETCLEKGIEIPKPVSEKGFSGKFILRLDPQLHMTLSQRAQRNKTSLNQYVRWLLEKQISNLDLIAEIKQLGRLITSLEHRITSLEQAFSSISDLARRERVFWIESDIWDEKVEPESKIMYWGTGYIGTGGLEIKHGKKIP